MYKTISARRMDHLMLPSHSLSLDLPSVNDSSVAQNLMNHREYEKYKTKYFRLRKMVKDMIYENAALCDEVARTHEKMVRAKEERMFLLKKVAHFEAVNEVNIQMMSKLTGDSSSATSPILQTSTPTTCFKGFNESCESKSKRKVGGIMKKSAKDLIAASLKTSTKRKRTTAASKRIVQPIPLDSSGRPIFPIILGGLTVHSLGEIVGDRPGFHSEDYIFPVGFCSTRIYASTKNPEQKCLYTCKITDGGNGPLFEIGAEDDPEHPVVATSATECHSCLLKAVNASRGMSIIDTSGRGAKFFGFSHPTIQNLIQSCPGARKCSAYKWIKFEVCKPDQAGDMAYCMSDNDATISFDALQRNIHVSTAGPNPALDIPNIPSPLQNFQPHETVESSSLRTLLTNSACLSLPTEAFSTI